MGKINVLPFAVANLIAAGEVVDRPASVIKELMENAIDAGADRITVEIQNGGVTFMRVSDNGCGMEPDDLPTAIRRHATSKIRTAEDLDGILTLGFRGEALAAIASVSDMRIISKTAEAEYGTVLEARGGEILGGLGRGKELNGNIMFQLVKLLENFGNVGNELLWGVGSEFLFCLFPFFELDTEDFQRGFEKNDVLFYL